MKLSDHSFAAFTDFMSHVHGPETQVDSECIECKNSKGYDGLCIFGKQLYLKFESVLEFVE